MRRITDSIVSCPSTAGLVAGVTCFAASLTPSLVPRGYDIQGLVSSVALAAGYGGGVFARWLWAYLELPVPGPRLRRILILSASFMCASFALG